MIYDIKVAIVTTPRANKLNGIREWKEFTKGHFAKEISKGQIAKLVVAMPSRIDDTLKRELNRIIDNNPNEYWVEMKPGLLGAGDIFRRACFYTFEGSKSIENIPVNYVLHVPIDVNFNNPHPDDIQNNLRDILDPLLVPSSFNKLPDLVIGDYVPTIWDEASKTSYENYFKTAIEDHVIEQLNHYFRNNVIERLDIKRPRSEFFVIGKELYNVVIEQHRFSRYDPIPQILIFADRNGFGIEKVEKGV